MFPEIIGGFKVVLNVIAKQHHLADENVTLITTFILLNPLLRDQFFRKVMESPAKLQLLQEFRF